MIRTRLWSCTTGIVVLSLVSGCVSAFQVSEDAKDHGLPFYSKSVVFRQHSLYDYPWLRVSVSSAPIIGVKDGVQQLGAQTTRIVDVADDSVSRIQILELQELVAELQATAEDAPLSSPADIQKAFDGLAKHALVSSHLRAPDSKVMRPVGNYVERVSIVDFTKPHYLNARAPIFGSSNLAAELAPDGTLSKGSNNVTGGGSEALGAVVSALTGITPIKEILTAKWVPTQAAAGPQGLRPITRAPGYPLRFEMKVEQQSVTYDFMADSRKEAIGDSLTPVAPDFQHGLFTVKPAEKAAEKESDNALAFSGKVQLPEVKKP